MFIKIFENRVCNLRFANADLWDSLTLLCIKHAKAIKIAVLGRVSTTTTRALLILILKYIIYNKANNIWVIFHDANVCNFALTDVFND